jgi:hypothetical protein
VNVTVISVAPAGTVTVTVTSPGAVPVALKEQGPGEVGAPSCAPATSIGTASVASTPIRAAPMNFRTIASSVAALVPPLCAAILPHTSSTGWPSPQILTHEGTGVEGPTLDVLGISLLHP